ncbi:MAG: chromosomal replication initiator protein DnaA [Planctomycetota bacterium]
MIEDLADALRSTLQSMLAPEQYQTWFKRSKLVRVDDQCVVVAVPNAFAREWIAKYYLAPLEEAVRTILGVDRRVVLKEQPESLVGDSTGAPDGSPASAASSAAPSSAEEPLAASSAEVIDRNPEVRALPRSASGRPVQLEDSSDFVLNPKCTFDHFVVGPCNRFGHAAALGASEQPGKSYNPLFLHGRVGVGKTHLLQGFCFSVLDRFPESRILYLSCETFVNHFIAALENGDMLSFRDKYRNIDVLVVDDIQLLANKERTQEEFFHTFNSLYNAGKQIVLSSDSPPKDIPTLQDRLVSRFKWGMVTEIEPPCFETRMAIVKRKGRDRGTEVPDEVAQFIAENIEENVRELEGAVTRLFGYTQMTNSELTVDLAREALSGLIEVRKGAPTVDDIITIVTEHYQVKLSDLQSKRRTKIIAFPRQVAMYLARKVTRHSLEEIGGFFGGRDHTTVLYAVEKIEGMVATDTEFARLIHHFMDRLGSAGR